MASVEGPEAASTVGDAPLEASQPFRIGYLFSEKKAKSFLRQELIDACKHKNILFLPIDRTKQLMEAEADYNAILHKDNSSEWAEQLRAYMELHPSCILIDNPKNILPLHNRVSMLECVDDSLLEALREAAPSTTLRVPRQFTVTEGQDLRTELQKSGLVYPVVAKPLVADGSAASHKMFLVLNEGGLRRLGPPLLIQEFINHGGVLFKVYVVGNTAVCTPRKSLPDCYDEDLNNPDGIYFFSQISNLQQRTPSLPKKMKAEELQYAKADSDVDLQEASLPDDNFVQQFSRLLRKRLNLTLFNYDLVQDTRTGDFLIVDINYFPGFAKMPNYPEVLSDYFASLARQGSK